MKKRILAVHLLNDRSGSPLIFRQALEVLRHNYQIELYTATPGSEGFLSNMDGVHVRPIFYKWHNNKAITLLYFMVCQLSLFIRLLFKARKSDTIYINTLLPFGAALAGKLRGCRIIYHVHETSLKPAVLKKTLFRTADITASKVLFVSKYVSAHYPFRKATTEIIYNSLPGDFLEKASGISKLNLGHVFTVSMLCSMKAYKGIHHFVNIARCMPGLKFNLVLNASPEEVNVFRETTKPPANCSIYPVQKNIITFYERSHVILNLSKPEGWIETFGMTILEAMYCGRPVICPQVGGVLELVTNGIEGYTIDSKNEKEIVDALKRMSGSMSLYKSLSDAAYKKSVEFSREIFEEKIFTTFSSIGKFQKQDIEDSIFHKTERKIMARN